MKKGTKIIYILMSILEVVLLIGAYMVNYFTNTKMGMSRHVAHKNYVWESTYPITTIKYTTIIALLILMLAVLVIYMKRKYNLPKVVTRMNIVMVLSVVIFIGFILICSPYEIRAFYYVSFILGVTTLVQIMKTFIAVMGYKIVGDIID